MEKFNIPNKMNKTIANVEMLVRLGIRLDRAATICGFTPEETARLKSKMRQAMTFAEVNFPNEDVQDDDVDIVVTVGDTGLIRRKYD